MALNGPLILRDAGGKLLTDTGDPVGFNGGTPVTIDRKLTITDQSGGPWKVAGLEYDVSTRLAESIIGPAINWIAGVPLNAGGEVWAEDAPVLFYAPNAIPITASGAVAMSVGVPPGGLPPLELADSVTTSDNFTFVLSTARLITDEVFTTDSIGFVVSANSLADTVSPTDAITKSITKALSDIATTTDALNQLTDKSLADTTTSIDSIAFNYSKELSDTGTTLDNIIASRVIDVILTDNVTTTDNVDASEGATQALADSVNATDSINVALSQALGDSASAVDSIAISPLKALADSASSTDNITLGLGFSQDLIDSVNGTDNIAIVLTKSLADSSNVIDSIAITPGKDLADSTTSTDGITTSPLKVLADTTSSVDNITAPLSINRSITDNVVTVDDVTPTHTPGSGFDPATLFAAGEQGGWWDPSDMSTIFQDAAGTTPVTTSGQPLGRINDKSGRGNNRTQSTAGSRPLWKQEGGRSYIEYNGVDQWLVTGTINFGTGAFNKIAVWAGIYREVDPPTSGCFVELSVTSASNNGVFMVQVPGAATFQYFWRSRGNADPQMNVSGQGLAPQKVVWSSTGDLPNDIMRARINGVEVGFSSGNQGTGDYGNYPLYTGRRAGTSQPFKGRDYGLIVRGTTAAQGITSAQQIADGEQWLAPKIGLTFP